MNTGKILGKWDSLRCVCGTVSKIELPKSNGEITKVVLSIKANNSIAYILTVCYDKELIEELKYLLRTKVQCYINLANKNIIVDIIK